MATSKKAAKAASKILRTTDKKTAARGLAQPPAVLSLALAARLVRRNHFDALFAQLLVEPIAVVGLVANQVLGLRLDHVEVERQLHQRDLVVVRRVRRDRQRQSVAIDYRHDFHAFSARRHDLFSATLGRCKAGIDEALRFIHRPRIAQPKVLALLRTN